MLISCDVNNLRSIENQLIDQPTNQPTIQLRFTENRKVFGTQCEKS